MMLTSEGVLPPPKTALVPLATAPVPLLTVAKSPKSFAFPNVLTEKNEIVLSGFPPGLLAPASIDLTAFDAFPEPCP